MAGDGRREPIRVLPHPHRQRQADNLCSADGFAVQPLGDLLGRVRLEITERRKAGQEYGHITSPVGSRGGGVAYLFRLFCGATI